jgi:hypothetical protein
MNAQHDITEILLKVALNTIAHEYAVLNILDIGHQEFAI